LRKKGGRLTNTRKSPLYRQETLPLLLEEIYLLVKNKRADEKMKLSEKKGKSLPGKLKIEKKTRRDAVRGPTRGGKGASEFERKRRHTTNRRGERDTGEIRGKRRRFGEGREKSEFALMQREDGGRSLRRRASEKL